MRYRAAEQMKAKYGDRIVHVTYPDNFMQEQETVIGQITGMASDPEVKAIVNLPGSFRGQRGYRQDQGNPQGPADHCCGAPRRPVHYSEEGRPVI
jgi:hypothetical protein